MYLHNTQIDRTLVRSAVTVARANMEKQYKEVQAARCMLVAYIIGPRAEGRVMVMMLERCLSVGAPTLGLATADGMPRRVLFCFVACRSLKYSVHAVLWKGSKSCKKPLAEQ